MVGCPNLPTSFQLLADLKTDGPLVVKVPKGDHLPGPGGPLALAGRHLAGRAVSLRLAAGGCPARRGSSLKGAQDAGGKSEEF